MSCGPLALLTLALALALVLVAAPAHAHDPDGALRAIATCAITWTVALASVVVVVLRRRAARPHPMATTLVYLLGLAVSVVVGAVLGQL